GEGPGPDGARHEARDRGGPARVPGRSDAEAGDRRALFAARGDAGLSVTPARRAALETLRAIRQGRLADRVLARAQERLAPRDRAWLQELVYGTLRLRGRLDHILDRLVQRGLASLEPDVLDILRLGAYQLLEMRSVPAHAAVSQQVELAKSAGGRGGYQRRGLRRVRAYGAVSQGVGLAQPAGGRGAGALVNGVLHALVRRGGRIEFPDYGRDPVGYLSTWGSHPRWLVERWVE